MSSRNCNSPSLYLHFLMEYSAGEREGWNFSNFVLESLDKGKIDRKPLFWLTRFCALFSTCCICGLCFLRSTMFPTTSCPHLTHAGLSRHTWIMVLTCLLSNVCKITWDRSSISLIRKGPT